MKTLPSKYSDWVINNPKASLSIIGAITLFFAIFLLQLQINATPYVLERHHPSRVNEPIVNKTFTNTGEQALVSVATKHASVFNTDTLATIQTLTNNFQEMSLTTEADIEWLLGFSTTETKDVIEIIVKDGIQRNDLDNLSTLKSLLSTRAIMSDSELAQLDTIIARAAPVRKVRSISANVENVTSIEDDLDIHYLMGNHIPNGEALKSLESEAISNPMYNGMLLSKDNTATNIQVEFSLSEADSPSMLLAYKKLIEITDAISTDDTIHISGPPVISAQISDNIKSDNDKFFPFVVLVISLVLYLSFKRKQGIIIPLTIAILTTIWTLGLMAALGVKQNIITTVLPVFLITIGVADAIHFISVYYQKTLVQEAKQAAQATFNHLFTPLFLTSLTTICGFLALSVTELTFLREFGLFIAAGVFFAFVITMTLLPALLPYFKQPNHSGTQDEKLSIIEKTAVSVFNTTSKKKPTYLLCMFSIAAITFYGSLHVSIDNENIDLFDDSARLKTDTNFINEKFGGTIPVNIWLKAENPGEFTNPETIIALDKITKFLANNPNIGYTISSADFVKRMNQVLNHTEYSIPSNASKEEIAQYFFLYENSAAQQIRDVLDPGYQNSRIIAFANTDKATTWQQIISDTKAYSETVLPSGITIEFTGFGYLMAENLTEIIHGQVNSLLIATILITTLMIILFKSVVIGLIAIAPLIITLLINFTLMALFNVNLDIGTSMIAGIVFGIGVDYPIHFMSILKKNCQEGAMQLNEAIVNTLKAVSRPIAINSTSLALGFTVLALSSHGTLINLGLLISGTMFICGITALITLPLLTAVLKPKALTKSISNSIDENTSNHLNTA